MKKINSVDYHQLLWRQKKWGDRYFEMVSGDDRVGVLYWPKWLSDLAVAESGDGNWIIDRPGFFKDRVVVKEMVSKEIVAEFRPGWLGDGEITLWSGNSYKWYRTGILSNNWSLEDEKGDPVFEVKEWLHWFKHRANVGLQIGSILLPELPILIYLSWYLAYMQMQDAAAAVAATSAVI
jgi:hypothetical protein